MVIIEEVIRRVVCPLTLSGASQQGVANTRTLQRRHSDMTGPQDWPLSSCPRFAGVLIRSVAPAASGNQYRVGCASDLSESADPDDYILF